MAFILSVVQLAKQIVELHGGELNMVSELGEGSEFCVVLPKTPALLKEPS